MQGLRLFRTIDQVSYTNICTHVTCKGFLSVRLSFDKYIINNKGDIMKRSKLGSERAFQHDHSIFDVPYSREQKHVSVSDMSLAFQIAYEGDFRSLCTVNFGQKVDFLNSNTCQCSRLYGTQFISIGHLASIDTKKSLHSSWSSDNYSQTNMHTESKMPTLTTKIQYQKTQQ